MRDTLIKLCDGYPEKEAFLEEKGVASVAELDDKEKTELFAHLQERLKLIQAQKKNPA